GTSPARSNAGPTRIAAELRRGRRRARPARGFIVDDTTIALCRRANHERQTARLDRHTARVHPGRVAPQTPHARAALGGGRRYGRIQAGGGAHDALSRWL